MVLLVAVKHVSQGIFVIYSSVSSFNLALQTSLACRDLAQALNCCHVVHQDSYFTNDFIPYADRIDDSLEKPDIIDWISIRNQVSRLCLSAPVVVEGHVLVCDWELLTMADILVIVDTPKEVCRERRLSRRDRSEKEINDLGQYFDKYVWPSFSRFTEPNLERICKKTENLRILRINGTHPIQELVNEVLEFLVST